MHVFSSTVVSKIDMIQLLRQIVSFIQKLSWQQLKSFQITNEIHAERAQLNNRHCFSYFLSLSNVGRRNYVKNINQKHKKCSILLGVKNQNLLKAAVECTWISLKSECPYFLKKMQLNPYLPFVLLVFNQSFNQEEKIKGENLWDNYIGKCSWRFK